MIEIFVARGANPDSPDHEGMSPLCIAAREGNVEAIRILVGSGADPNSRSPITGNSPLHFAVLSNQFGAAKALLEANADANATNAGGIAALHLAAATGKLDILRLLLDRGADVNSGQGTELGTPLSVANDPSIRETLEACGAV